MSGEYGFFTIVAVTLIAYYASVMLVKNKMITIVEHRRCWNWVLLASFLVSGLLGILMSFVIDQNVSISHYGTMLWLHVEAGIVMVIVSIFHLLWHKQYFIKKRRRVGAGENI